MWVRFEIWNGACVRSHLVWAENSIFGSNSTLVYPVARQSQKQQMQIYPLGLPVSEKMVSLQTLFRAYCFGTFCFQQNSETSPADFAGEVFHSQKNGPTGFGRFRRRRPTLEKPSSHKENYIRTSILSKYAKPSSWRSCRRFERPSKPTDLPFLEDSTKRTRFWSLPKQKTATACW